MLGDSYPGSGYPGSNTQSVGTSYSDSATVPTSSTITSLETSDFVEVSTVSCINTVSSSDTYTQPGTAYTDSATLSSVTIPSGSDVYTPGPVVYTDSATVKSLTSVSSVDIATANSVKFTVTDSVGSFLELDGLSFSTATDRYVAFQFFLPTATEALWLGGSFSDSPLVMWLRQSGGSNVDYFIFDDTNADGVYDVLGDFYEDFMPKAIAGSWHKVEWWEPSSGGFKMYVDGIPLKQDTFGPSGTIGKAIFGAFQNHGTAPAAGDFYIARIKIGTSFDGSDILNWDGSVATDFSAFTSVTGTVVLDNAPTHPPAWAISPPANDSGWYGGKAGSVHSSNFYTIGNHDGTEVSIGASGFALTGLAVDPTTGIVYGSTSALSTSHPKSIITINPLTGVGTFVGSTGLANPIADITFDSTGQMYGYVPNTNKACTIDKATGAATLLPTVAGFSTFGCSNAIDQSTDIWYLLPNHVNFNLYTVDKLTGALTLLGAIVDPPYGSNNQTPGAADFDASGKLWIMSQDSELVRLGFVDIGTLVYTFECALPPSYDALMFIGPPPGAPSTDSAIIKSVTRVLSGETQIHTSGFYGASDDDNGII